MGRTIITTFKKVYAALHDLFSERGWERVHHEQASRLQVFLHFWVLVIKSFLRTRCPIRATALSYTTLLALIPLLAIGASVTSGLLTDRGADATTDLIDWFVETAAPQLGLISMEDLNSETGTTTSKDAQQEVVNRINQYIENFHTKSLGLAGLVGVILVAVLLLTTIEQTFNDIWGVTRGRSWFYRLVQYWSAITLGPLILALTIVLIQGSQIQATQAFLGRYPVISSALFKVMPFILISIGFALLYKLIPNTQVRWRAALMAGVVGGSLWLILNLLNASFLGRAVTASKLYGSLAIIPIFLVGLYFSWLIVLFGAQFGYAVQHRRSYLQEKHAESVSEVGRELLAIRLMTLVAHRFETGQPHSTLPGLADELGVSTRLVSLVVDPLLESELLVEISGPEIRIGPGRPPRSITCQDALQALRAGRSPEKDLEAGAEPEGQIAMEEFVKIQAAERSVAASVTFKELSQRLGGPDRAHEKKPTGRS